MHVISDDFVFSKVIDPTQGEEATRGSIIATLVDRSVVSHTATVDFQGAGFFAPGSPWLPALRGSALSLLPRDVLA